MAAPPTQVQRASNLQTVRSVQTRPEFSLADTAGVMRSITEWDGKAMVVNFWATWCAPCRREMPLLKALQAEYTDADIQIIGIAVDLREDVLGYLEQAPVNYPVMIGDQDAIDAADCVLNDLSHARLDDGGRSAGIARANADTRRIDVRQLTH